MLLLLLLPSGEAAGGKRDNKPDGVRDRVLLEVEWLLDDDEEEEPEDSECSATAERCISGWLCSADEADDDDVEDDDGCGGDDDAEPVG